MTRARYALSLMFAVLTLSTVHAGTIPYNVVVLDRDRVQESLLLVDMDSGVQRTVPIIEFGIPGAGPVLLATDAQRNIYVLGAESGPPIPIAKLDTVSMQWEEMVFSVTQVVASDFDVGPNGTFVLADDFGVSEIDLQTGMLNNVLTLDESQRSVEIDSKGAVVTSTLRSRREGPDFFVLTTEFVRKPPGTMAARTFEVDGWFDSYVLESDDSLIAIGRGVGGRDGKLYRIDLNAGILEVAFEHELLLQGGSLAIDPSGRIITVIQGTGDLPDSLARIDLSTKAMDVVTLSTSSAALSPAILVIPEPSAIQLLLLGVAISLVGLEIAPCMCSCRQYHSDQ